MTVKSPCLLLAALTTILTIAAPAVHAAPVARLPRTGQTTCWDTSGTVVTCTGTGQDGDKLQGVTLPDPRFTDSGNGTIRDNLTGLVWLKNANCFGYKPWTTAVGKAKTLASGACGLTDGSKAGDWRLPNRRELLSLLNRQQGNSITYLGSFGFSAIQQPIADDDLYWTSTTSAEDTTLAWVVNFSNSSVGYGSKTYIGYIWPVRDGQ